MIGSEDEGFVTIRKFERSNIVMLRGLPEISGQKQPVLIGKRFLESVPSARATN
jgi:hypothetical protein